MNSWVYGSAVEFHIVRGIGQGAQCVVKRAPFGVDNHLARRLVVFARIVCVGELGDLVEFFDVGAVGTRSKDGAEEGARLAWRCVGARHERSDGVVDERSYLDGQMQVVNLVLQEGADVLADGILNIEALGPAHQQAFVDADLVDGKGKGETEVEYFVVLLSCVSLLQGTGVVFFVVLLEEGFDLLGEEGEELLGCLRNHELARDGNLGLREGKGGVAVQSDRADTEVCAAQIDRHVEALFGAVGDGRDVRGNLAQFGALGLEALFHLASKLADRLVDSILPKLKLGSHALGLVGESHAALWSRVEGSEEVRRGWQGGLLEDDRITQSQALGSVVFSGKES